MVVLLNRIRECSGRPDSVLEVKKRVAELEGNTRSRFAKVWRRIFVRSPYAREEGLPK